MAIRSPVNLLGRESILSEGLLGQVRLSVGSLLMYATTYNIHHVSASGIEVKLVVPDFVSAIEVSRRLQQVLSTLVIVLRWLAHEELIRL